jgi:hypothetical protein
MNIKAILGTVSTILAILSFIPYMKDIFSRKTTPHIYSWLIWSILQITAVIAMVIDGAKYGALGLGMGALVSISVFLLAFKYGTKNITRFDTFCLIGALIAIAVWIFLDNILLSMVLITLIDFVGFLPTYRKSYEDPHSETAVLYAMSGIANLFAFLAISNYTIVTSLYVASLVLTNAICVLILIVRRKILIKSRQV